MIPVDPDRTGCGRTFLESWTFSERRLRHLGIQAYCVAGHRLERFAYESKAPFTTAQRTRDAVLASVEDAGAIKKQ